MTSLQSLPKANRRSPPLLRLTPYAWAKLLFLRDAGETEVGGFGISSADQFLLIEDFCLVQQECTAVTVKFSDQAVADHFDRCVDQGLLPERFGRIWIHTHPGNSARPSSTDETTFARCFGRADWSVMVIVAAGGQTYARLHFKAGPGGDVELPVEIDFTQSFAASNFGAWEEEYLGNVFPEVAPFGSASKLDRELAQEFFGPLSPAMFPDELGPFDPFLEDLHGFDRFDRPVCETERIATAVCA